MTRLIWALAALAASISAQTTTSCYPLNTTCPADGSLGTTYSTTFNQSTVELDTTLWNITAGKSLISFGNDGMAMAIHKSGDSVTVKTAYYIMFGRVEVIFKAAAGAGIISSAILLSDDLDEIDWEIKGSNTTHVSTNWFGQGDTKQINNIDPPLSGAQSGFHNYTLDWTQDRLEWILDGNVVRTLNAAGPKAYPQTPSYLSIGMWAAGDPSQPNGTIEWSEGPTDYTKGPFIMTVQSVKVTDYSANSSSYTYGDRSGSWQSIKTASGQSKAYQYINKLSTTQSAVNSWNGLSTAAKIGIACGVAGGLAIAMIAWCAYCCVQRRKGREEKRIADEEWDAHQSELLQYRRMQQKGQFAVSHMSFDNKF